MSLLPPTATFAELVAECFVAHRGQGLMLSALDAQLVAAWAQMGAPFEVVARGIRRAAEKALFDALPGQPALRSLKACRREVEAEIRKHRRASAGKGTENGSEAAEEAVNASLKPRQDPLLKSLRAIAKSHPFLADACARLAAHPGFGEEQDAGSREAKVVAALLRALPFAERFSLLRTSQTLMGSAAGSIHARRLAIRFHRASVLRRTLDLPPIW